ncbi:MAG: hypothetical protein U0L20_01555 [Ruminococcus sp.]|nr:hypothetical protein [Ruminococcus sp.]
MQSQAKGAIASVSKESGVLKSRLQGVGTSIYAFAKTTGMDSAQALLMMEDALKVTADSAAYYDRSLEDTAESLKSFLKGNYENDAALGLSCTETTRNIAANKLYGKSFQALSESQKQLTLLQMVKDANKLSGAMGQASRESEGWENVTGNLKESWNQLLAVIGKPILQGAVAVVQKMTTAITLLTERARKAVDSLYKLFGWEVDNSSGIVQTAKNTADTSNNLADSVENQKQLNEESKKSVASFDKLNVLSANKTDNSSNSSSGGSELSDAYSVLDVSKSKNNSFGNLYEKSGIKVFVEKLQKKIDSVDWGAISQNCQKAFKEIKPISETAFIGLKKIASSAVNTINSKIGFIVSMFGKSTQTITGGISKWLEKDKKKIVEYINTISKEFSIGFDNISATYDKLSIILGDSIDRMRPDMETAISVLLSGLTTFAGKVGVVISEAFSTATESILNWIETDGAEIGLFLDTIQQQIAETMEFFGGVFEDIGTIISNWWNGENGQPVFQNICDMFTNIGTTFMNVYNEWIKPVWDFIAGVVQSAWNNCIHPIFEKMLNFFGKLGNAISTVWNNFLSPIVNWFVDTFGPILKNVLIAIKGHFDTVFTFIGDVIGGLLKILGGICDFISGVFSADWEKAWEGIKAIFEGVWERIWGVVKGIINLIIDGINDLWTGIYNVISGLINGIGGIAGAIGDILSQDWDFSMPEKPPLIPKLAKGGIVKAPTLAVVGDNAGANTGNPEVIAPLNKLQGMINTSSGEDVVILTQILDILKRLYEMFIIFRNQGGNSYEFIAKINGSELFNEMVKQNELYKKRNNGKSAFA